MKESLKVAILVLNFNGKDCLPACLASLKTLTYPNYQVLVIDNGSQDTSLVLAQQNFPEYHFIKKQQNTGFASGMNTGIQWAENNNFDFVWLLNYDTRVYPDTLTELIKAFQKNPTIRAMSPVIVNAQKKVWYAGGTINYLRMRTEHSSLIQDTKPYQTNFLTGCAPFFSIALLKKVNCFDERFFLYYEDADLSCRIRNAGEELFVIPSAHILHSEKSVLNSQKIYYLVYSSLLFFALHTPKRLRPYIALYVTIRRLTNKLKRLFGRPGANLVAKAYADYFEKFQAGYQLHLRKLS